MWKIVITEIQDANELDPTNAPPGAFFVSTERFSQMVDHLDLAKVINVIHRMQPSFTRARRKRKSRFNQRSLAVAG
jgi:hypothetical protein